MGWKNPAISWSELERTLSGRGGQHAKTDHDHRAHAPRSGQPRPAQESHAPRSTRPGQIDHPEQPPHPYAELHAHSHYSFLDGASSPEALVAEAARLQLSALAITDHDGFQGAARFAEAALEYPELATVYGAELSLGLDAPQLGVADPRGTHLLVLAQGVSGYHQLASAITDAQLAGDGKGQPHYDLEALAEAANGEWAILTGCRKGAVQRALATAENRADGERAARAALDHLTRLFGQDRVFVELTHHGLPKCDTRIARLAGLADAARLPTLATGGVHYAAAADAPLADAIAAVRARRSLDEIDPFLPATGAARLRSGDSMRRRFARYPAAVARTAPLAEELAFPLRAARPRLPKLTPPDGRSLMSWLRDLTFRGAAERYRLPNAKVTDRLEKELALIEAKDFPGYFLIVHDIVQFARSRGILCQGRGSAANSAVCYVLGITAVDSVYFNLPFERFLSSMREEEPDIDVDFESGRREEVIQYVYEKYGRKNAAQVANVISYRPKSAVRDAAKALGYSSGQQRAWTRGLERWSSLPRPTQEADRAPAQPPAEEPDPAQHPRQAHHSGHSRQSRQTRRSSEAHRPGPDIPPDVLSLADRLMRAPRHLGIHSGGMVLTERPVGEVCPIEHARMPGRTVLQWDKDDCAAMGLVKFDLLGLGMLSALQLTIDLAAQATGERWTLASIPKEEPGVYDMLCRADAIGVFQLESRAQLNTLPRLKPRRFYDLVIEIALIRPGPLQGGAIHPYLRRRDKTETVTYPHPSLEPVLKRTLGVPLFQEQLMQMAMAVGGCSADDADLLRRAMGSKRGTEKIEKLRKKLFAGMHANGIEQADAERIYAQIEAFADFGFAESHSISFALLVYASAWFKLHYPAAFLAGLLRSQPMGFYSPRALTEDAKRHGVEVRPPDVQHSLTLSSLESLGSLRSAEPPEQPEQPEQPTSPGPFASPMNRGGPRPLNACLAVQQPPVGPFDPSTPDNSAQHRRDRGYAVRLGLAEVRGIDTAAADRIVAARRQAPFQDLADLARRADLDRTQLEALSVAGACTGLGLGRREALWAAGPAADNRERFLPGVAVHVQPPLLPVLTDAEQTALDLWSTGVVSGRHPLELLRASLDARGATRSDRLRQAPGGGPVSVAGLVTHRQRPGTAGGITFMTLEDEVGNANVVVWPKVWERFRFIARSSPALFVTGRLERSPDGLVNVIAHGFEPLTAPAAVTSRDFQ